MRAPCKIEGCDRGSRGRGWCGTHWLRWRKYGDPLHVKISGVDYNVKGACAVADCGQPAHAHGFCPKHYTRFAKHGDPEMLGQTGRPLKGAHPTFAAVHKRIERTRGAAITQLCVDCGDAAREWSYNNADPAELAEKINGTRVAYSIDLTNYSPRCISCHRKFDKAADKRERGDDGRFVRITIRRAP